MTTCDKCFDGRHIRCGGRNGCECNVCKPMIRAATAMTPQPKQQQPPRLKPKQERKRKTTTATTTTTTAVGGPPNGRVTHGDIATTLAVLAELPSIIEETRIHVGLSLNKACVAMDVHLSTMRDFVQGKRTQGYTQQTLERILMWIESTRQENNND